MDDDKKRKRIAIIAIVVFVFVVSLIGAVPLIIRSVQLKKLEDYVDLSTPSKSEEKSTEKKDEKKFSDLDYISEFDNGVAVVEASGNTYVVNTDFEAIWKIEGHNDESKDGYFHISLSGDDEGTHVVYDKDKNEKLRYSSGDYTDTKLLSNGCILLTTKEDTYNSTSTKTGIYDLEAGEYILGPSEEYHDAEIYDKDEGIFEIIADKKYSYYNSKERKFLNYAKENAKLKYNFVEGYSICNENNALRVYTASGDTYTIPAPRDTEPEGRLQREKMYYDNKHNVIYDLEKRTTVDLNEKFNRPTNEPIFYDGKALVRFDNGSGALFYAVVDKEGNFQFDPERVGTGNNFIDPEMTFTLLNDNLSEGYILGQEAIEDGEVSILLDYKNNEILRGETDRRFLSVTNGVLEVQYIAGPVIDYYCYMDLDGNKIEIKNKAK